MGVPLRRSSLRRAIRSARHFAPIPYAEVLDRHLLQINKKSQTLSEFGIGILEFLSSIVL